MSDDFDSLPPEQQAAVRALIAKASAAAGLPTPVGKVTITAEGESLVVPGRS